MASLTLFSFTVNTQHRPIGAPSPGIINGIDIYIHIPTIIMLPSPSVGKLDVMWSERVWSFIDLRDGVYGPFKKWK